MKELMIEKAKEFGAIAFQGAALFTGFYIAAMIIGISVNVVV